jgi:hypothetical protein
MKIRSFSAANAAELCAQLGGVRCDFISVHTNCALDLAPLRAHAEGLAGAFHGASSCLGAMTDAGITEGIAAFTLEDPEGQYATEIRAFDGDPRAMSAAAVQAALAKIDRVGETPDLVWLSATPGAEEAVLEGLQSVLGADVPIIGGSAADNAVAGGWFVFDGARTEQEGLAVTVMFPSTQISFAYHNGYSPEGARGVVTKASGRVLHEIDGRPAMTVYSEWTQGAVRYAEPEGGAQAILSDSTLWPLGREMSQVGGVPFYLLAHPATAHANGDIDLFANVETGETLTLMTGTIEGLAERAGRVAALARKLRSSDAPPVAGALMIYCGGCMLTVREELGRVVSGVNQALGGAPFLGAFTFGEQGALVGAGNRHGNLMISCIIFSDG